MNNLISIIIFKPLLKKYKTNNSLEINGEIYKIVGGKWLVLAIAHLLVAVNAMIVQHVQQQFLTASKSDNYTNEKRSPCLTTETKHTTHNLFENVVVE